MKYILSLIISGALVVSGFGQTRNVLVGTNNAVVQPTNFWSADASNARTGLGLGTAATNAESAFQPSSATLSNLATANGGGLTNLQATSLIGLIPASNIPSVTFTNIAGILAIASGGTGATNASDARQNLGSTTVGDAVFVATNPASARTALGATTIGGNIFTAVDASSVRTVLELGTAATNAASAFQPSSLALTNLASNDGGSLTNLQASNLVGTIAASNIPTVNLTNISGVLAVNKGGTGATNASDARTALGATTVGNLVFTATNAQVARTVLSLGTAATSAVTAFQPANANLTNLSTNNGASLTGIPISGVVNLQSNLDTKLATNGNGSGLTSLTAANINGTVALASNITGTAALATNVTGTVAIANGGTGSTTASGARTALGASTVGGNLFTLVNPSAIRFLRLNADNTATALSASDFRTAIGLSTAATNAESAFQPASTNLTTLAGNDGANLTNIPVAGVVGALATNGNGAGLTNLTAANITGTVALASNLSSPLALTNGGTGATNAATARTNLGLGTTNSVTFASIASESLTVQTGTNVHMFADDSVVEIFPTVIILNDSGISFQTTNNSAANTRTNLGIPWSGLTNTNAATFQTALFGANTNPVLVDTNGEVVSPTNFWQAAPIATTLQNSQPVANATNAATNARLLFLFSLAPSTTGVTNIITLPTNGSTFNGDVATITHAGPTSSVTAIRELGDSTNLITLNQVDETVRFLYRNDQWELMDNISYIEPIYFSGTNAVANAAASRTNLGLGATNDVTFNNVTASGTLTATGTVTATTNLNVGGAINVTNKAETRTNLGIGGGITTNLVLKNGANIDTYMNFSNGILIYGSTVAP